MNIHISYQAWTYEIVRERIIEAAETLILNPAALGPRMAGAMSEVVRIASESYGYGSTGYRRIPSPGALTRMEEAWSWINSWLCEADRKLVYDYGFIKTRKGLTLAKWCENNGWIKRTFERAVNRCCQQIADNLNRNHEIRLTAALDAVSRNHVEDEPSKVTSVKYASFHREPDAIPRHDDSPEAAKRLARQIEKLNAVARKEQARQQEAKRKRAA